MKILLLRMKITDKVPMPEAPLGLLYIASVLENAGHEVIYKDLTFDEISNEEWKMIERGEFELIGITMLSFLRNQAYDLIKKVKSLNTGVKIIVGGVHASATSLQLVDNFPIDAVILGEGELTVLDIVECMQNKGNWGKIRGIATKEGRVHEPQPLIQNLDSIPFPAFHLTDIARYKMSIASLKPDKTVNGIRIGDANWVGMIASRGCVGRCIFCNAFDHWGLKVRFRSPENMLNEIEWLQYEFGVSLIAFNDDAFPILKRQCMEFCNGIIKRGIKIAWQTTTRPNVLDPEMCQAMRESGCFMVAIGCESGSQKILDRIKKFIKVEDSVRTIRMISENRMWSYALLMIGNPGESDRTIEETIQFLQISKPDIVSFVSGVMITPGTEMEQLGVQAKLLKPNFWVQGADGLPFYTAEASYDKILGWSNKVSQAYPNNFDRLK